MALADIRWSSQLATPIQSKPLPFNGAHATLAPLGGPLLKEGLQPLLWGEERANAWRA